MPVGAATEALFNAVIQLFGVGSEVIRDYFGWKGCMIALLAITGVAIALYYLLA